MISFAKGHAYGNDFLYVEASQVGTANLPELAREMCARHTGIGGDGLVIFRRTAAGAAMQLFNADGSRAEVSGNGVRVLGALLGRDADTTIETEGGIKVLVRTGVDGARQTFRASMGLPAGLQQESVTVGDERVELVTLNMGNPQAIILGPLPDDDRFNRLGAALEWHPRFPDGTNVEFAHIESATAVRIRIWERGVGPTTSSGTGSCASLVAAAAFGGAARDADVIAPGGTQRVTWADDSVYLTGWAEMVCEGRWLRPLPQ